MKCTGTDGEILKQRPESVEADVVESNMTHKAVADLQTGADSDGTLYQFTGPAAGTDSGSISDMSAEVKSDKAVSIVERTECKENSVTPVTNGALEAENFMTCQHAGLAANSEVTLQRLYESPNTSSLSDRGASGDYYQQQPVSPGSRNAEPDAAEFIAVVRRRRKDAGAKPKTQQPDDVCSSWHRRPARPAYTSPKSTIYHHSTGWSSPSQMQSANLKSANVPGTGLWDSTPSAFPALPSLRVRRNSTGDVPAASESNDDGSDLESVKSAQMSTSRRTAFGRSLGTSSYASVVVGNVSNKEPVSTNIIQSSSNIQQKSQQSPLSDGGIDSIPSRPHSSDQATSEEVTVGVSPVEASGVFRSMPAGIGNSDFMVDSRIIQQDEPSTDDKVSHNGRQTQSSTCPHASCRSHAMLFFDTRSKSSSTPVPSLDISFGFDDSVASEAISSDSSFVITCEPQSTPLTAAIPQSEPPSSVEFLQRSSVAYPSTSSRTSTASLPRSSFDLRAAQKYLLSGECLIFLLL